MLKEDYCDKDTAFALQELGYNPYMFYDDGTPAIHLWYAQKFLREEKNIIIYPEKNSIGWFYTTHYNIKKVHRFKYSEEYYDSYEEALSEGIKEAIKILKDGIGK